MKDDEQLYEAAAKELASAPRAGLLAKCTAKSEGDENKANAMYLEVRVDEMKDTIKAEVLTRPYEEILGKFLDDPDLFHPALEVRNERDRRADKREEEEFDPFAPTPSLPPPLAEEDVDVPPSPSPPGEDVDEYSFPTWEEQRQQALKSEREIFGSNIEDEEDPANPYWWSDEGEE